MNLNRFTICGLSLLLGLCGCTIAQTARPVPFHPEDPKEMCVIEDPRVDETFLPAYKAALERRGLSVKVLQPGSPIQSCPLTSTYYARWSWDFVPYMSLAKIVVYRDGKEAGDAVYDAPKAGWALTFRIYESTQSKVDTMVDQLFPGVVRGSAEQAAAAAAGRAAERKQESAGSGPRG